MNINRTMIKKRKKVRKKINKKESDFLMGKNNSTFSKNKKIHNSRERRFKISVFGYYIDLIFTKEEISKSLKFLILFLLLSVVINFILSTFLINIEFFVAVIVSSILKFFNIKNTTEIQEDVLIILENLDRPIAISYLCTGILETSLLISAILSSLGIPIKKRLIGAFFALFFVQFFNLFRIVTTIFIMLNFNIFFAELSHQFLFKFFLFVSVALAYTLWFFWATKN